MEICIKFQGSFSLGTLRFLRFNFLHELNGSLIWQDKMKLDYPYRYNEETMPLYMILIFGNCTSMWLTAGDVDAIPKQLTKRQ